MTTFQILCSEPNLAVAVRGLSMDQLSEVSEELEGGAVSLGIPTVVLRCVSRELQARFDKIKIALKCPRIDLLDSEGSFYAMRIKTYSHSSAFQIGQQFNRGRLRNV